ncbi:MAG TPA: L,D-transpeptidase family protein [Candidatus Dormibacteraeota bacterium]|nr:L,D-transpeptidase family protein [Candidatus Dormibacteraeota bacterium]
MSKRHSIAIAVLTSLAVLALYARWPSGALPERRANQVVVFKERHRMDVLRDGRLLKSYRVALGRSPVGPKLRAGDHRTPEGCTLLIGATRKASFTSRCTSLIPTGRMPPARSETVNRPEAPS